MKSIRISRILLPFTVIFLITAPLQSQDLLYAENFANTNSWGMDETLGTPQTHWFGLRDGSSTNNGAAETFEDWYSYDGYWSGPALNNDLATTGDTGVILWTAHSISKVAVFTREYTSINAEDIGWISWDMLSRGTGGDFNLLLKVGGEWYTPDDGFSLPVAFLWTHFSVDLSAVTWVRLDGMDPEDNSSLEPASIPFRVDGTTPVTLPTGPVQAFGLFIDSMPNERIVLDNYKIFTPGELLEPVYIGMGIAGTAAEVRVESTLEGHCYQLEISTDDMATWEDAGYPQPGNGGTLILSHDGGIPAGGEKVFFRVVDKI